MAKSPTNRQTMMHVEGVRELLRVLSKLPKDLQSEVRDASTAIADDLVGGAKAAASTPQQRIAAAGLSVRRDRVPVVAVGTQGVGSRGAPAREVFYGAEFGGARRTTTQQFPSWRGSSSGAGYFLYPTARARGTRYFNMWADAIDKAFADWDYKAP